MFVVVAALAALSGTGATVLYEEKILEKETPKQAISIWAGDFCF